MLMLMLMIYVHVKYRSHHLDRAFPNFFHQHVSQLQSDSMLAGYGAFQLNGSPLYSFEDFHRLVFFRFGADDCRMIIAWVIQSLINHGRDMYHKPYHRLRGQPSSQGIRPRG